MGNHLRKRLSSEAEVAALTRADLDITNREAVRRWVSDLKPKWIFNCAVLQVDESERSPAKAWAVNMEGPRHLAQAATEIGAEIVQFSTQYVFEGEPVGRAPYTIEDPPRPVNVYGRTKVAGEQAVRKACAQSYIVRTSWVYGSGKGSFLCSVYNDLQAGKTIRAIDDLWSSTTFVGDLIDRCLEILVRRRYATYHIVNAGVCTYYEFALEAGRLAGLSREQTESLTEVIHERDIKRVATRPRYTPLRCLEAERLELSPMRDWRDALAAYVKAEKE